MTTSKQKRLQSVMLPLSMNTEDWGIAKLEWRLDHISRETNKCVCGQAIKDNCHMKNIVTKSSKLVIVGSCCVQQFICKEIGETGKTLVKAVNAIEKKPTSRVGQAELIKFAKDRGVLDENEASFLRNIGKQRESTMSERQSRALSSINKKMSACAQSLEFKEEFKEVEEEVEEEEKRVMVCAEQVKMAKEQGLINDWEVSFMQDMQNKIENMLSEKQMNRLIIITNKMNV